MTSANHKAMAETEKIIIIEMIIIYILLYYVQHILF